MWTFYADAARSVCIITEAISSIDCDQGAFCLWSVGLWVCRLRYESGRAQPKWREVFLFRWNGQIICCRLSYNFAVFDTILKPYHIKCLYPSSMRCKSTYNIWLAQIMSSRKKRLLNFIFIASFIVLFQFLDVFSLKSIIICHIFCCRSEEYRAHYLRLQDNYQKR
jgi:hypothetical protein